MTSKQDFIDAFVHADPEFIRVQALRKAHQEKFQEKKHGMTKDYLHFLEEDRNIGPGFADDVIDDGADPIDLWERAEESFIYWNIDLLSGPYALGKRAERAWNVHQANQR